MGPVAADGFPRPKSALEGGGAGAEGFPPKSPLEGFAAAALAFDAIFRTGAATALATFCGAGTALAAFCGAPTLWVPKNPVPTDAAFFAACFAWGTILRVPSPSLGGVCCTRRHASVTSGWKYTGWLHRVIPCRE